MITQKLLELDPTLVQHNEGSWSIPYTSTTGYSSFNDAGIECETGEFLYALARLLKPQNILETGTHHGIGASYMGMAVLHNHTGHLETIEFLPEIHKVASRRIQTMGLNTVVSCHLGDVANFTTTTKYQLILLDTEPQTRFAELIKFYLNLDDGGYIFIHDLHNHMHQIPNAEHGFAWPYGKIPEEMRQLVTTGKLRPFHFHTPRGLTGFYKPSPADYQW